MTDSVALAAELRELIEAERVRFDVPGVGVAVIADGEVLFAEGFGTRDVASGAPVTGQTLFPIASDTKCFTAATLCALADEGLVDLDAPVREYVPWFRMHDQHATELVSARDLLSHRTGLPRHDFVWYGEGLDLTLEDVTRALRHLPLSKQVRQTWQYNNNCFNVAGYLTEQLTGLSWSEAVRSRILDPLGMKATGFDAREVADGDFATPYNKIKGELKAQVLPASDKLGPPGGIVSNAEDMARWVLARLGKEVDGTRVLSDGALAQLHTPTMIGGTLGSNYPERQSLGYGLGCQVEAYRGHRIVRHGGNLVGYSSDVCVAPSLDAAVVVMTNLHGTGLRDALALMVLDRIAGLEPVAWGERYHEVMTAMLAGRDEVADRRAANAGGRPPSRPLEEFAGVYTHPAYGALTLAVEGESLAVGFHGLGDRLRVEHRDRDAFDLHLVELDLRLPVVFTTDSDDTVTGITVPFEALVPAIPFDKQPPAITEGLLDRIEGVYEKGPIKVQVAVVNGVVQITAPGAGTLALTPKGGNVFVAPSMPAVRVEFEDDQVVVEPLGIFPRA
jgi:CubicO group peptidase (beta-lactamase class C family)